jgi:hypothetical protein
MSIKSVVVMAALSVSSILLVQTANADNVYTPQTNESIQLCTIKNNCPPPLPAPPMPKPKHKGPDININLGFDGNGYGGGGYGNGGYGNGWGISCGEGRSILRHRGYHAVHKLDCSGSVFAYSAIKHGQAFEVDVNRKGHIVDVSALD